MDLVFAISEQLRKESGQKLEDLIDSILHAIYRHHGRHGEKGSKPVVQPGVSS